MEEEAGGGQWKEGCKQRSIVGKMVKAGVLGILRHMGHSYQLVTLGSKIKLCIILMILWQTLLTILSEGHHLEVQLSLRKTKQTNKNPHCRVYPLYQRSNTRKTPGQAH